jgi:DNA polymerase IV
MDEPKIEGKTAGRRIIHVDMDAFFAQVEQRDHPEYKNKPLIVGGPLNRGVISTASYEARKYGLHSGMPLVTAKRLCPDGIYVPVDMEKYLRESYKIRDIFFQFTPLVEVVGCDEGFLDVTGCERLFGSALEIAKKIKGKIYEQTNLTSSAGIGTNKFLAKLASGLNKPNGLTVLEDTPEMKEKIMQLPVSFIWGVGRVTDKALLSYGIKTIGDLFNIPIETLKTRFGEAMGQFMHDMASGLDNREVTAYSEPKSMGREITFTKDIDDMQTLKAALLFLSQKTAASLYSKGYRGKTVTIKVRYSDFKTITKRVTFNNYTSAIFDIYKSSLKLLKELDLVRKKVRLIGVSVSGLKQSLAFDNMLFKEEERKGEKLTAAIDKISEKFGDNKLIIAAIRDF